MKKTKFLSLILFFCILLSVFSPALADDATSSPQFQLVVNGSAASVAIVGSEIQVALYLRNGSADTASYQYFEESISFNTDYFSYVPNSIQYDSSICSSAVAKTAEDGTTVDRIHVIRYSSAMSSYEISRNTPLVTFSLTAKKSGATQLIYSATRSIIDGNYLTLLPQDVTIEDASDKAAYTITPADLNGNVVISSLSSKTADGILYQLLYGKDGKFVSMEEVNRTMPSALSCSEVALPDYDSANYDAKLILVDSNFIPLANSYSY